MVTRPVVVLADVEGRLQDGLVHRRVIDGAREREPLARDRDAQDASRVEGDPLGQRAAALAKLVEEAGDRPGVAPALRALPLELVDLLDDVNRNDYVVVFEPENGLRVVEQDVRVEDVVLLHSGRAICGVGRPRLAAWRRQRKTRGQSMLFGGLNAGDS